MRNFTKLISCAFAVILFTTVAAFGQVDPAQKVIVIENTEVGIIETTINGDDRPRHKAGGLVRGQPEQGAQQVFRIPEFPERCV